MQGCSLTEKVDAWSYGCVIYEMFAGVLLFGSGRHTIHTWCANSAYRYARVRGFSQPWGWLVLNACSPILEQRPRAVTIVATLPRDLLCEDADKLPLELPEDADK